MRKLLQLFVKKWFRCKNISIQKHLRWPCNSEPGMPAFSSSSYDKIWRELRKTSYEILSDLRFLKITEKDKSVLFQEVVLI